MKKLCVFASFIFTAAAITALLTSCRSDTEPLGTSAPQTADYTYIFATENQATESLSDVASDASAATEQPPTNTPPQSEPEQTTASAGTPSSSVTQAPPATEKNTRHSNEVTEKHTSAGSQPRETEVDLSIDVPSANGKIEVDTSRGNKFTVIVSEERKIDSSLLLAVYSVPDSGQNYVFEFSSKTGRTEDDLRRVYLIDANGKITGVAAKKASEKENITAVENWFCMNVLIKNLLFPAVEKEFS